VLLRQPDEDDQGTLCGLDGDIDMVVSQCHGAVVRVTAAAHAQHPGQSAGRPRDVREALLLYLPKRLSRTRAMMKRRSLAWSGATPVRWMWDDTRFSESSRLMLSSVVLK